MITARMRPTKNKEPNTKMDKDQKIFEMLQDLSAYCTLFTGDAHLGRVINHAHAAIVEVLHTGDTEVLPYSYGAKKKLDAKFAGQINEWN